MKNLIKNVLMCAGWFVAGYFAKILDIRISTTGSIKEPVKYKSYKDYYYNQPYRLRVISFSTSEEADVALKSLKELIDCYGYATVEDYYDVSNVINRYDVRADKYGWKDLNGVYVEKYRIGDGYHIKGLKERMINFESIHI